MHEGAKKSTTKYYNILERAVDITDAYYGK